MLESGASVALASGATSDSGVDAVAVIPPGATAAPSTRTVNWTGIDAGGRQTLLLHD